MNTKLSFIDFELKHLKLNSKSGLVIDWFDLNKTNDLLSVDSDSQPHEDLINCLNKLKAVFAESLGLLEGWDFARENNRKNEEKLIEAVRGHNEQINRCKVSGLTITDKGIKITGSLECNGGVVGLASPLIKFEDEDSEIGEQSKIIVNELSEEVWKFIYKQKRANDLFNQKDDKKSGLNNTEENRLKAV